MTRNGKLAGKVALVTGGSRGIGAAVAVRLAEEGADVVLTYEQAADRAAEVVARIESAGARGLAIRADCAVPSEVEGAVERAVGAFGRLDVLVNNAAVFLAAPLEELSAEQVDRTLAVNVRGPFTAAQAAARHMGRGGRIVNVGSNVGERAVFPGLTLYAMSKTALGGLTRGLARELGPRGITVNLVHPGPTDTDANPADGAGAEAVAGFTALGRYARPGEVAAMVVHLAGAEAGYVTGASIAVDGGFTG
jgi:3-oxoacyl-[acyl-carrier protein] reductase